MKDMLVNLLKMEPQNLIPEVNYLAAFVWLMVLICAFFSLKSQKIGLIAKLIWSVIIVCIPLAGLFAYCIYCITKLELTMLPGFTEWQQKGRASANEGAVLPLKTGNSQAPQNIPTPLDYPNIAASRTSTKGTARKE